MSRLSRKAEVLLLPEVHLVPAHEKVVRLLRMRCL